MEIVKGQLYKQKTSALVVMANNKESEEGFSGQVIIPSKYYKKGYYADGWNIEAFQPYSAEIIIKEVIDFSKVQFIEMASGEVVITDGEERDDKFDALNLKTARFEAFKKSEAKRVVTANFT